MSRVNPAAASRSALTRLLLLSWRSPPRGGPTAEPQPLVRVLGTEDELNEAVEHAIAFEQAVTQSAQRRIEHYAQARRVAQVMQMPLGSESQTDPGQTALSNISDELFRARNSA